jgi:serine/threonine-protein kinase
MSSRSHDWCGLTLANGRYLVTAKLGEGGMGTVYHARDLNIDADVVIKVPLRSMLEDAEFFNRFTREIHSLVKLSHPRIVKVTDVGAEDGLPFAVMQFLPGGSLEDRQPGRSAESRWAADPIHVPGWLGGIAEALDYVHGQGYVHRDVKPGNLLFDAQGYSFLGDFGVVKVVAAAADEKVGRSAMTGTGMVLGTPEYMAPELIMGESFDGRVDQYALAITVYEMLAGRRPFEDEVKTKLLVLQTSKSPPPLHELAPWIPAALSEAVHRGLAKDPNDRFPNCGALARGVTNAIEAECAGRPERVRGRCPSCSRTLALPPADFTRLSQSGRAVACPGCKAPIRATAAGGPPNAATRVEPPIGTMVLNSQAAGGTVALDSHPRGGTVAINPQAGGGTVAIDPQARGATVAINPQGSTQRIPSPAAPGAGRAGTMILGAPGQEAGHGGAQPDPLGIRTEERTPLRDEPTPSSRPGGLPPAWVLVGGGVAVSALALTVALLVLGRTPAQDDARPGTPAPGASAGPAPARRPAETATTARAALPALAEPAGASVRPPESAPGGPTAARLAPASVALAPTSAVIPDTPTTASTRIAYNARSSGPIPATGAAPVPGVAGGTPALPGPPRAGQPEPVTETPGSPQDDSEAPPQPVAGSVALEQILKAPQDYANKQVVLTDVYCIADAATIRNGWVSLEIVHSDLNLQFSGRRPSLQVGHWKSFELGVDRELATHLLRAGSLRAISPVPPSQKTWRNHPAIVTVVVTRPAGPEISPCRIVKLEFATRVAPEIATVARKRRLKVIYRTLTVTPEGSQEGMGEDEDWAPKTGRLRHITTQFNKLIDAQKRATSAAQWNAFNAQFNAMMTRSVNNLMRSNAIENAERIREMTTPRPVR